MPKEVWDEARSQFRVRMRELEELFPVLVFGVFGGAQGTLGGGGGGVRVGSGFKIKWIFGSLWGFRV